MALVKLSLFKPKVGFFAPLPTSVQFTLSSTNSLGGYVGIGGYVPPAVLNAVFGSTVATSPQPVASALHDGTVGVAYSTTISVAGGTGPFTFSVSSGSLPAGLAIGPSTGIISGTPTALGTYSFTVGVVDVNGATGTQNFSIIVSSSTGSGGASAYAFVG